MRKYIFPFLVFIIGFYLIGIRLVGLNMDGMPGDFGDGRLNNYFLEHGYQYLTGQLHSYWDASFFYPEKATMSISDNLLGTLPLYAAWRITGLDRETAYQAWFLCLLALNFFTCFVCLKKLKLTPIAASLGAFIFAFAMPVAGGLSHTQMFPKFMFPLIIYCLVRFIQLKTPKYLFFFLLFTVYQMYCGIYLGFMSLIASVVVFFVMVILLGFKNQLKEILIYLKKHWMSTVLFFILNAAVLLMLFRPYILRSGDVERNYRYIASGLPTWISYAFPAPDSLLYRWLNPLSRYLINPHEHTLFMGVTLVVALILAVWVIRTKKNIQVKFWLISFLSLIFLTLNFYYDASAYILVYALPGFKAIRAVSRIVQIELFFLGALVGVLVDHFISPGLQPSKRFLIAAILLACLVADQFVFLDGLKKHSKKNSQYRVAVLKDQLIQEHYQNYQAFAYLPSDHVKVYAYHVDAMLASQDLGIPTVNGYSAFSPKNYEAFFEHPNDSSFLITRQNHPAQTSILLVRDLKVYLPQQ
jgi:hypothetical protein